ncbi:MAG: 23S rRNA (pseudouridine(1915)-N(3))-methyltransferase RlmH [Chitinophagaceae bacterium]
MKFQFWSVGKVHETYVKAGIEDFTRRLSHYYPVEWAIIPVPRNSATLNESNLIKKEGEFILSLVKKDDFLVALDERGRQVTSEGLAELIQTKANNSVKQIIFLIGGAYGLDKPVLKRADFVWSLSSLVFPHQLVRLILSEQVYRACTILRNERYHHA